MYQQYNPNPKGKNVGDCTVRAIAKATEKDCGETYLRLAMQGYLMGDMPSANACWGAYLRKLGFVRKILPDTCPDCYTLRDFSQEYSKGTYIVALPGHVVCVEDGEIWGSWDSGESCRNNCINSSSPPSGRKGAFFMPGSSSVPRM